MIEPALEQLSAEDVGHPPGTPLPFRFIPAERITPLVISLPHVGLDWPNDAPRARPAVEFARNADYEVHLLYSRAAALGAAVVRAEYSRLLVDLNRAPDDDRAPSWSRTTPPRVPTAAAGAAPRPGIAASCGATQSATSPSSTARCRTPRIRAAPQPLLPALPPRCSRAAGAPTGPLRPRHLARRATACRAAFRAT